MRALGDFFPGVRRQCCVVHFERNILKDVPHDKADKVEQMFRTIYAQESRESTLEKGTSVASRLREMKLLHSGETLTYYAFPAAHRQKIRTNNVLERLNREIRRRTDVVESFPDSDAALMLVADRLRYILSHQWGTRTWIYDPYEGCGFEEECRGTTTLRRSFWFGNKSSEFNFCERYLTRSDLLMCRNPDVSLNASYGCLWHQKRAETVLHIYDFSVSVLLLSFQLP